MKAIGGGQRGCAPTGDTRKRCLFGLVAASALIFPLAGQAQTRLEPGFYVDDEVRCSQASAADLMLVHSRGFSAAPERCELTSFQPVKTDKYRIGQSCTDLRSGETVPMSAELTISSSTLYFLEAGGRFVRYRLCPQADLPEPWRSADLPALLQ